MEVCSQLVQVCRRCAVPRLLSSFYHQKQDGRFDYVCKLCFRDARSAKYADPVQAQKRRDASRECYHRHKDKKKAQYKLARLEMIEAYGGRCVCCDETRPEFLSIDHIFNDGAEERASAAKWRAGRIQYVLRDLGWPKDRYQLLCFNCNIAKHIHGECPHVKAKVAA